MSSPTSIQSNLKMYVDTDYAVCPHADVHQRRPGHAREPTQAVVVLSSGEAEYYGVVKGMCEAPGIKGIANDMGLDLSITLPTGSSAAKGIATRKGLGGSNTWRPGRYGPRTRSMRV